MKIGVYGFGRMGKNHARVYRELGIEVLVYDINREALLNAKENGFDTYSDVKRMIKEVEAVSICVSTKYHKNAFLECLDGGIQDILIEKPLSSNSKDCKEMINSAKRCGCNATIGYVERFNPAIQILKKNILPHKIRMLDFQRFGPYPPRIMDCGITLDTATHDIDLSRYITEVEPKYVFAISKNRYNGNFEDYVSINLDFGKAISNISADWTPKAKKRELNLTTDDENYNIDLERQNILKKLPFTGDYKNWKNMLKKSVSEKVLVRKSEPLKNELSYFIECVKKSETHLITLEDGLFAIRIAENALKSAESGRRVKIIS